MKIAILSDIHANLEALTAVLQDLEARGAEKIFSLGDIVGYGPDPEEVVRLVRRRGIISVMGNHDAGVAGFSGLAWFNPEARSILSLTRGMLSVESLEFLRSLPVSIDVEGALLVHGCPPHSFKTYIYMVPPCGLKRLFLKMAERIAFVGHTHELMKYSYDGGKVKADPLPEGLCSLDPGKKYILNIGSVGQPRDGDIRAKYVIWDVENALIQTRFISYDVEKTSRKIIDRGFPRKYAMRLKEGENGYGPHR